MEKKMISILLGSLLILSLLPMGAAETTLGSEETQGELLVDPDDIEIHNEDPETVYLGEQNVNFTLDVTNTDTTESIHHANLTIEEDANGPFNWTEPVDNKNATIGPLETVEFYNFTFNVPEDTEPDTYHITAILNYTDEDGNSHESEETEIEVTVNSLDELVTVDVDDLDVYIGQKDVEFTVEVTNWDDEYPLENCNVTISHEDEEDWVEDWYDTKIGPEDIGPGDTEQFDFQFNVSGTEADHQVIYELTASLNFTIRNTTYESDINETFEVDVDRNVEVSDPEQLTVGEDFQEMEVDITNVGDVVISDITLTLDEDDLPDGVDFSIEGGHEASYRENDGELNPGQVGTIYYRVDVDPDADLGSYTINYELDADKHYENEEEDEIVEIEEYGTFDIDIGASPVLEAEIEDGSVDQGVTHLSFDVTFENIGNVDLYEIEVILLTDEDYFLKAVDHYEYGEGITEPEIYIGDLEVEEEVTMNFELGLHRNLQPGNHRLLFDWDGYFYHEVEDRVYDASVEWDNWDEPGPTTPLLYVDGEEVGDWIGPDIFLEVEMVEIDFSGESDDDIELDGDITNVDISIDVTNHELVDFKEVEAQLMVGEGTPFFNPIDRDREYVEMHESAQELPGEEETTEFTFTVNINTDFVSERIGNGSHAYEATLMITQAVNVDTNEEYHDIEVNADVEMRGYGPNLVVNAELSDHELEAGENFTLEYTIKNVGDETARETNVSMIPDLYHNDWEIIDGYIRALASSSERETVSVEFGDIPQLEQFEGEYTEERERSKNTSHLEMDLLGIEDAEDIVDLHMYIEGALSAPRPHVWHLYVGEINPGDEYTVSFEMVTSEHTQIGQPYQENIHVEWMDANGDTQTETYPTTIRLAEEPVEPEEPAEVLGIDAAVFAAILVIIILAIVLAASLLSRRKGGKEKEEETFEEMEEEPEIEEEPEEPPEPFEPDEPEDLEEPEEPDEGFEEMEEGTLDEEEPPEPPFEEPDEEEW